MYQTYQMEPRNMYAHKEGPLYSARGKGHNQSPMVHGTTGMLNKLGTQQVIRLIHTMLKIYRLRCKPGWEIWLIRRQ